MPQNITELTTLSPNPKNYLLHHNIIDNQDYFSLKNKNIEGDNHFTFKPLNEISINNVIFTTAQELISAFNVNFNQGEETPQNTTPTLQQVTDTGNFTNKQIFINTVLGTALGVKGTNYGIQSEGDWAGGFLFTDNGVGIVALSNNAVAGKFYIKNLTNNILECYYNDNTNDFLRFHVTAIGEANANAFIKNGGLATEFLKADGSVDSSNYIAGSGTDTFLPKFNEGVLGDSRIKEEGNIVTFESNDIQSRIRLKNNAGGQIDIGLFGQYAYTFGQYFVFNDEDFSYFKIYIANLGIGNAMRITNSGTMSLVPNNRLLVGTEIDNGVDKLQVTGNANVSDTLITTKAKISEDFTPTGTPFYSEDFSIGLGDFTDGGGTLTWVRVTDEGNGDLFSAKSGAITHNQNTVLVLTKTTTQNSTLLQFDYKVSTEQDYDFFYVEVNGIVVRRYSGTIAWTTDNIYIHGIGNQTIKFIYRKDAGDTAGSDSVWIDNVKLINAEESYVNYKPALYKDDLVVQGDLASKGLFSFKEFTGKKGTINESLIFNDINGKLFGFITPILNSGLVANFYNTNEIRGAQVLSELTRTGINFNHPTTGAEAFKFQSNSVGVDFLQIPSPSALIRFGGTSNLDPTFMFRVAGKSLFLNNVLINSTVDNGVDKLQVTGSLIATAIKKTGGTSSQFLKADGSVDTNTYQTLLTNPITGTGASGQLAYFNGANSIIGLTALVWDNTNGRLGVNNNNPAVTLDVSGSVRSRTGVLDLGANTNNQIWQTSNNLNFKTNGTEKAIILANGNFGIGTNAPTNILDANGDTFRLRTARTIATATTVGNAGEICWDANYIYVCIATNTWKRTALTTW